MKSKSSLKAKSGSPAPNWRKDVDLNRSPTLRVGFTPEENLVWLLRFMQRDELKGIALSDAISELGQFWVARKAAVYPGTRPKRPSAEDVSRFARRAFEGVNKLKTGRRRWLLSPPRDLVSIAFWDGPKKHVAQRRLISRSVADICLWQAQELIAEYVHRIERCHRKVCGKWFLVRKRGKFCSPQCASIEHVGTHMRKLSVEEREYLHRKAYLQRLQRTDRRPADRDTKTSPAAERYLKHVERTDPNTARRLRKEVIEKRDIAAPKIR